MGIYRVVFILLEIDYDLGLKIDYLGFRLNDLQ
jgi:hypothetical protein